MEVCKCTRAKRVGCKKCVNDVWGRDKELRREIIRIFKEARNKSGCKR
jgi:hypothetical protein